MLATSEPCAIRAGTIHPGDLIDGRFLVLERLREGGTCSVWKAADTEAGDLVALKVPRAPFARDAEFLDRFSREERIGLRLAHPALVSMRPVSGKSFPYLVMEFVKGETLEDRLARGRLPVADAVRIAAGILEGLGAFHARGFVHRDVTPRNVLLGEDGSARILDYGIAEAIGAASEPGSADTTWGTPAYMAPEQVQGLAADARTDLYAVGLVLYEMLTGTLPFTGEDPTDLMNARLTEGLVAPRVLRPDLPAELEEIVLSALRRERKDRPASAREMRAALEALPLVREALTETRRRGRAA